MVKLTDFARQMGVTERAIQKHLKKYAAELEGTFERKGPNGTWLSDEACEFLRSKMKQAPPPAIFDADPRVEQLQAEKEELQRQLNKANENFQMYVTSTAETLMEAKHVKELAERSEDNRKLAESLKAQNRDLSDENAKKDKTIKELKEAAQKDAEEHEAALEAERNRPIPFREWWRRRKKQS